MTKKGKVYLVGAGPGDPGLITVKGLECLKQADVIVYDHLADARLLSLAKPGAESVYVGKESSRHTMKQEEINALLADKAQEGKTVVRLKGGDPFVLGRGGEEAETLAERGIPFEVVPGVTAALAVPAYAGIPVTHRGLSSSVAIITGHEAPGEKQSHIAWERLTAGVDTLVFLMGWENLPFIVEQLQKNGLPPITPVAAVSWGTLPQQQTVEGTLGDIVSRAAQSNMSPPAVIIVGRVVELRSKLRWFDTGPLFGKRVLVTRSRAQASELSRLLSQYGAQPVELPTIEIEELPDHTLLDRALAQLPRYTWVIFTSANGVDIFFRRLRELRRDARELGGVRICVIGPATAAALEKQGLIADLVPEEYIAEGIVSAMEKLGISGSRVLLPRAEIARAELTEGLRRASATVEEIALYRTISPRVVDSAAREWLWEGKIDIITFTSSSTARHLKALLRGKLPPLENTVTACIGPVTAATAAELGFRVDIVAREHTIPGLVKALAERYI